MFWNKDFFLSRIRETESYSVSIWLLFIYQQWKLSYSLHVRLPRPPKSAWPKNGAGDNSIEMVYFGSANQYGVCMVGNKHRNKII